MAFKCQRRFGGRDTPAVIGDAQQAAPSFADFDANLRGPRIDAVLDQLFDYVGRPFDNLAGCNLSGHLGWQNSDGHSTIITGGK